MASKFARVIAGCFFTLCHLMGKVTFRFLMQSHSFNMLSDKLPLDKREECLEDYESLFDSETLWKFASHESPIIRKALYRLVKTTILKWKGIEIKGNIVPTTQHVNDRYHISKTYCDLSCSVHQLLERKRTSNIL